jgi:hypothetical protein
MREVESSDTTELECLEYNINVRVSISRPKEVFLAHLANEGFITDVTDSIYNPSNRMIPQCPQRDIEFDVFTQCNLS